MPVADRDPILTLPTGPSIAVLPFDNMSGDPEQEYFRDGLTEDIIKRLSRFPRFFVIARNSTYQYKGQAVDVREVGRDLGARYVVEGSVRKSGDSIRVTAQLLDAENGTHLWAETYDRDLNAASIFEIQDDITARISAVIAEYQKENYDAALKYALKINIPDFYWTQVQLAAAYGQLGRTDERRKSVNKLLALYPDFGDNAWAEYRKFNASDEVIRNSLDGLRKAGLDVPDDPA